MFKYFIFRFILFLEIIMQISLFSHHYFTTTFSIHIIFVANFSPDLINFVCFSFSANFQLVRSKLCSPDFDTFP